MYTHVLVLCPRVRPKSARKQGLVTLCTASCFHGIQRHGIHCNMAFYAESLCWNLKARLISHSLSFALMFQPHTPQSQSSVFKRSANFTYNFSVFNT